jgi:hypothetical protein
MPRRGPTEQDVLRIVMDRGNEGILQSALWREMKADSREGSRAILRLERKGLIERKRELHSGRWTYRVFARRKYSSIDSIIDVPCSFCDIEARCSQEGAETPAKCEKINQWIVASVSGSASGR